MQLSLIRCATKAKSVLVAVKSVVSNHSMVMLRDSNQDKYEFIHFDPTIEQNVIYREAKKLKSAGSRRKKSK
jgi:ribosomal protein L33